MAEIAVEFRRTVLVVLLVVDPTRSVHADEIVALQPPQILFQHNFVQ